MFFHFGSLVRRKQSVGAVLEFNGAISGRRGIIVNRHKKDEVLSSRMKGRSVMVVFMRWLFVWSNATR